MPGNCYTEALPSRLKKYFVILFFALDKRSLHNSKHSRCIYTRRFLIKETLPLIEEMLVGKSPKPSSFTKGRNAYGKQNATKSDTLLRLRR